MYFINCFFFIEIPECSDQPCKHKGSCVATPTGFVCICKNGYDGFYCDDGENRKTRRNMKNEKKNTGSQT